MILTGDIRELSLMNIGPIKIRMVVTAWKGVKRFIRELSFPFALFLWSINTPIKGLFIISHIPPIRKIMDMILASIANTLI